MEKLSSNLLALNVGNVFVLTHLEAAEVLSELPNHQVNVRARDATVFRFSLENGSFTLINTGDLSFAVRIN
ncbi:TPA: hypothetical protein MIO61_24035 [Klebsiella pneumoniae subsp. pneumoniae]|mgnify:FL=1|jgi:hypothetical protein|uniref:Uncharacterized protein n=4 Tax=Klebsiella pneumoniae TaxID=573 RepID=A0A220SUI0_KLEPN|nr:hypothetical protein [Klebsiella pneumoniae]ARV43466.1 hypothetical protein RJA_30215 [Klebsiella pneumoniae subsp. pneumoniae]AXO74276.1 hypothetical protein BC497_30595 [Klebsiella variicola]EWC99838.1 hypothetical protein X657_5224 [Klebsiella pneumoniae NB60]EZQ91589.1 hypothetical protein AE77_04627 [Klebsiella pneumoniae CHS 21]MBR7424516.1 hypothetical protein [Klebsiella quasipneumoniae]MBX8655703.1 hypothetical protein [Klebsiella michiganensis]UWG68189.1 MAG: hypothetical protei